MRSAMSPPSASTSTRTSPRKKAVKQYVKVLSGETTDGDAQQEIAEIQEDHAPNFGERTRRQVPTSSSRVTPIELGDAVVAASAEDKAAVKTAITRTLSGATVLDVAMVEREAGGAAASARSGSSWSVGARVRYSS